MRAAALIQQGVVSDTEGRCGVMVHSFGDAAQTRTRVRISSASAHTPLHGDKGGLMRCMSIERCCSRDNAVQVCIWVRTGGSWDRAWWWWWYWCTGYRAGIGRVSDDFLAMGRPDLHGPLRNTASEKFSKMSIAVAHRAVHLRARASVKMTPHRQISGVKFERRAPDEERSKDAAV